MNYNQIITPQIPYNVGFGWCLRQVRSAYGAPGGYPTATAGANATKHRHTSRTMPNALVPVWFSHVGTYSGVRDDFGHVVIWVPSRKQFMSSPQRGHGVHWYDSIEEIERVVGAKYRFWTEDINGLRIVEPAPAPKPAAGGYTVRKGDSLSKIAAAHGTTWQAIYNANKGVIGSDPNVVHAGLVLTIPKGGSYTVRKGDSLSKIAAAHGTTWQALQKHNGIKNANVIHPGQVIRIP